MACRAAEKASAGDWLGSGLELIGLAPIAADLAGRDSRVHQTGYTDGARQVLDYLIETIDRT
ncbi:hypothetical protein ACLMAJ_29680 [Nocardia sp. KC 131]|uniref:hypothetical protein n=1 Tax=Nocardia arseniciresistens TaxID=3392119 RepID=UPI00398F6533